MCVRFSWVLAFSVAVMFSFRTALAEYETDDSDAIERIKSLGGGLPGAAIFKVTGSAWRSARTDGDSLTIRWNCSSRSKSSRS